MKDIKMSKATKKELLKEIEKLKLSRIELEKSNLISRLRANREERKNIIQEAEARGLLSFLVKHGYIRISQPKDKANG